MRAEPCVQLARLAQRCLRLLCATQAEQASPGAEERIRPAEGKAAIGPAGGSPLVQGERIAERPRLLRGNRTCGDNGMRDPPGRAVLALEERGRDIGSTRRERDRDKSGKVVGAVEGCTDA